MLTIALWTYLIFGSMYVAFKMKKMFFLTILLIVAWPLVVCDLIKVDCDVDIES